MGLDDTQNQWVSISTIVTGAEPSEQMFSLSRFCSSDAFYHLDMQNKEMESDLFLPVMLRKLAIAWNVYIHFESLNGAVILNDECTQENKIRIRNPVKKSEGERNEKAFFFYDIPAASSKHIGIVLDLSAVYPNPEMKVLHIKLTFSSSSSKRHESSQTVTLGDMTSQDRHAKKKAIELCYQHEARLLSQSIFHAAAENVRSGKSDASMQTLYEGESKLQALMKSYGDIARDQNVRKLEISSYAAAVAANLKVHVYTT